MLCQLSNAVRSVRVCDISELSLVPSISLQSSNHDMIIICLHDVFNISITIVEYSARNRLNAVVNTELFAYSFKLSCKILHVQYCIATRYVMQGETDDDMDTWSV